MSKFKRYTNECFEKLQTANAITTESYRTGYTYDFASNRLSMEKNGIVTEYNYDNCNRLIAERTGEKIKNFTYDVCGNLIQDGDKTYTYDELNRLAEITTQDGHVQKHRYDAEGLRHELEEDGKLVQFLYNHKQEVIAEESKEEGLKRYIRGLGLISSDCEQSKTYYHYVSDNVGSITHVLNENAETENEYQYDAFGNTIGCYENVVNRFRYAGEQYDAVTSQYYLRARYYNPVIGRFTQQDTYLGAGLNLYAYCDNNPLSYIDPSGHNPESAAGRQDIPPSYILEIPSVQRMIDAYANAGANAADTYANATNNYIDSSVQAQSNAIYGDATSGADAGTLAPTQNSTESAPVPTTPQTTALVPVAPMGSYPLVPVAPMGTYQVAPVAPMGSYPIVPYNANSNNPLITRQSMDVSSAVSDAGGRTDRRPLMPMNLQFFAESGTPSGKVWDYSKQFDGELANFNAGYEIKNVIDEDLYLVQFHSNAEVGCGRSLKYWTTFDEANGISTVDDYMNKMALLSNWGARDNVSIAKIPAGTEIKYAIGTAKEQVGAIESRPGGGLQILFEQFDDGWVLDTRPLP